MKFRAKIKKRGVRLSYFSPDLEPLSRYANNLKYTLIQRLLKFTKKDFKKFFVRRKLTVYKKYFILTYYVVK